MSETLDLSAVDPQQLAADPNLSAFVTANAGSGKTKTLIDRVARLLLAGARPQTILCVTYTKAAASEMQRRLYGVLGNWSVLSDLELGARLTALEDRPFAPAKLSQARALFAQALETPGGLKIQTIHAFCEKLLRRFPLEAGISPAFRVMDDSASAAVAAAARGGVARHALNGEGAVADAYARLSVMLDFQAFQSLFVEFEVQRDALKAFLKAKGGLAGAAAWVRGQVGVAATATPDSIAAEAMRVLDVGLWRDAAEVLSRASATDKGRAREMARIAAAPEGAFDAALGVFFTKAGETATWPGKTSGLKTHDGLRAALLLEQARLEEARERVRAAGVAEDTEAALTLAAAYLAFYEHEKDAVGGLDFADLIQKTRDLLADRPAAAWVLYKLDGGIDHILLDEAQDTAPDQWEIVDALTGEFFAGAGVGARERNMFVVGDQKQSIYSFQGARPELLRQKLEFHRDRATGAGFRFEQVDLLSSWRSTPQVLSFVDAVFSPAQLAGFIQPGAAEPDVRHIAERARFDHAGCVDVWPLEVEAKGVEREAWDTPLDAESETSANRRLAQRIAREIRALIDRGDAVFDKDEQCWRAAHAGDVLILVRRRKALFEEILRALKHEKVPVAGADRLALSDHMAFHDLAALARFLLFPSDDLTLAAVLKSPLCGLDDDSLYDLAHGRDREALWTRLQRRAAEQPAWRQACATLTMARELSACERPFELYARLLSATGDDGRTLRQRFLRRLGAEADEALDEYLNQVLAAEARGVHDLQGLVAELAGLNITIKREMDAGREEVRVMTAHGAKGLEAPIVFLPETTLSQTARGSALMRAGDGFLFCGAAGRDCAASALARQTRKDREEAETYRLLYVALTRARDRLVLCGRQSATAKVENIKGWWGAVRDALAHEQIAPHLASSGDGSLIFQRFGPDPQRVPRRAAAPSLVDPLPAWTRQPPVAEAFARYASPSELGQAPGARAASPLATTAGLGRFRRGDLIHRLLQLLPDLAPDARAAAAVALLARERDLTPVQSAEMAGAALGVLADPQFAQVFGPGSRPEVAIAGSAAALPPGLKISGRLDRLAVLPDRVLVVDFKTNRPSPARIEDADPAYLRQMALYAAVLGEIFTGLRIEAALVWTDGPKLMAIPEILLAKALADLKHDG